MNAPHGAPSWDTGDDRSNVFAPAAAPVARAAPALASLHALPVKRLAAPRPSGAAREEPAFEAASARESRHAAR
jgi:hypothetical protein